MWAKDHNLKSAKWHRNYYRRWRLVGSCVRCGEETKINKLTNKPFTHCFKHRVMAARNERNRLRRIKNEL